MRRRTWSWFLPQNEQLYVTRLLPLAGIGLLLACPRRPTNDRELRSLEDLVDDTVLLRLHRVHEEVAVGVVDDLVQRLAGVPGQDLAGDLVLAQHFLGLDFHVRRLA